MATDDKRFEELAGAILDGSPVDWAAAESDTDPADLRLVPHLKTVAAVASVHRIPNAWGHLHIIERIGQGSFGDVYRAWDPTLEREVALKLRRADAGRSTLDDRRWIEEARRLDSWLHDSIAESCGNRFLAQELGRLKLLFRAFRDIAWEWDKTNNDWHRFAEEAREHLAIVDGLLAADGARAARAMARHIESGVKYWSRALPA